MDKVVQWIGALMKKLLPAARRDPVAATLGVLSVFSEAFMLSNWQYWGASFSPFDSASPALLLLFVWRQYRRSWTESSLGLAGSSPVIGNTGVLQLFGAVQETFDHHS